MIFRFVLLILSVAALIGGWLYLADWLIKYQTKNIVKKILTSILLAILIVAPLIFVLNNISGL